MRFSIYQDAQGYWRWRLWAANNRVIADSGEGYVNYEDAMNGIRLVMSTNANTPIVRT